MAARATLSLSQTFDLEPATISLAKSLTSAYLPLSAVMIPEFIYQAVAEVSKEWGIFGHGFTYSGHPVSAALGLKVLEIYERDGIFERAARLGEQFQARLQQLADHPLVGEVRGKGSGRGVRAGGGPRRPVRLLTRTRQSGNTAWPA